MNLLLESKSNLNFKSMKPNQFKGFDYAVVRKYKAPVEKFRTNSDLQVWANNKTNLLINQVKSGRNPGTGFIREMSLKKWIRFFELNKDRYSSTMAFLALASLIKDLKMNNDKSLAPLRVEPLQDSFNKLREQLEKNKDISFDFSSIYAKTLKKSFCLESKIPQTGWFCLPSKKQDLENFNDNAEILKILSSSKWCTKSYVAEDYLSKGEFHIYFKDGLPRIAIRFSGCVIDEIQGENNNLKIPVEYIPIVKKHIYEGNYFINDDVQYILKLSENS